MMRHDEGEKDREVDSISRKREKATQQSKIHRGNLKAHQRNNIYLLESFVFANHGRGVALNDHSHTTQYFKDM